MNELTISSVTMTSREIAELVDSRHDSVKRTIERLVEGKVIASPPTVEKPTAGRPSLEYVFSGEQGKRDSIIVVAQLSPEFTARLVDRWMELEHRLAQPAIPRSLSEALRLAADQAERIEQQQAALALAAPKVEFVDRYVEATGSMGFRQVAKLLRANEREFRKFLLDEKVMYVLGGKLMPHAPHLDAGRFDVKTGVADNEHAFTQVRFTPKGVDWIAGKWAQAQIRPALAGEAAP